MIRGLFQASAITVLFETNRWASDAAVTNAILGTLSVFGARHIDMAALALARLLADATSLPGNLKEAAHWLEKLEPNHKGDTELLRQVCKELAEADPAEREAWLSKGAKYESHECMYRLAQCILDRDTEEALRWLRKVADLGREACLTQRASDAGESSFMVTLYDAIMHPI